MGSTSNSSFGGSHSTHPSISAKRWLPEGHPPPPWCDIFSTAPADTKKRSLAQPPKQPWYNRFSKLPAKTVVSLYNHDDADHHHQTMTASVTCHYSRCIPVCSCHTSPKLLPPFPSCTINFHRQSVIASFCPKIRIRTTSSSFVASCPSMAA